MGLIRIVSRSSFHPIFFLASLSACVFASSLWTGCATTHVDDSNPESLYKDAEEDIKSDHYLIAIDKLKSIRNKFPYSKYAIEAQLKIADVYFAQESFPEAAVSYEAFHDLHPKHEKAAYAMYRAGKSYFNDIPGTIARDLTPAQKAMEVYLTFMKLYPTAPEAVEAQKDIQSIRNLLAEKELYVGDFYFKREVYDSAKPRYKKIVELYPETPSAKTAKEKLEQLDKKAEGPAKNDNDSAQNTGTEK